MADRLPIDAGSGARAGATPRRLSRPSLTRASWRGRQQLRADRFLDPVVLLVSLVSAPLVVAASSDLSHADDRLISGTGVAVWAVILVSLLVRVLLGDRRPAALRILKVDAVVVVGQPLLAALGATTPALALGFLHAALVAVNATRREQSTRRAWRQALDHPLRIVVGGVLFFWMLWSSLALYADRLYRNESVLQSVGDALWWGAATMTTVGYGDVTPISAAGRGVAVAAMVTGIGAFSIVTAKLAELLLVSRDSRALAPVDVTDHTVLLGWSPKVTAIIRELVDANEQLPHADIVILSSKARAEAEREIATHIPLLAQSSTTVHCRTGSISNPTDLGRVHAGTARAIIVVGEGTDQTSVITALLALLSGTTPPRPGVRAIAEIIDPATALAVQSAFGERVQLVEPEVLLARVTAQSCRQPGLGLAYEELLDFAGSELYITPAPGGASVEFGQLLNAYPSSCPVGIIDAEGGTELCPPMKRRLRSDERLVMLAADADSIHFEGPLKVEAAIPDASSPAPAGGGEEIVVVGWSARGHRVLSELDQYLPPQSTIQVIIDGDNCAPPQRDIELTAHVSIDLVGALDYPGALRRAFRSCDHVIILAEPALVAAESDARALLATLQASNEFLARSAPGTIVTELLDETHAVLARQLTACEFIVSDKLASQMMSQLAESPELRAVFEQLLDPAGPDLFALPIARYAATGVPVTFAALVERARHNEQVAIGFRLSRYARNHDEGFGVVMNPPKDQRVCFDRGDHLIVLGHPDGDHRPGNGERISSGDT